MSFEVYIPVHGAAIIAQPGRGTLDRAGNLTVSCVDCHAAQLVSGIAVPLIDVGTRRIAFRPKHDDDSIYFRFRTLTAKKAPSVSWKLNVSGLLKKLGLETSTCKGEYEVSVKDGLLIILLGNRLGHGAPAPAAANAKKMKKS